MSARVRDKLGQFAKGTKRSAKKQAETALEDAIQATFANWVRLCLPRTVIAFSIPNEGAQDKSGKLVAMGLYAGAADFCIVYGGIAHFIEFKSATGTQKPKQRSFESHALAAGAAYTIARSSEDAIRALENWGIPHTDKSRRLT
jgi:hypothetical protein